MPKTAETAKRRVPVPIAKKGKRLLYEFFSVITGKSVGVKEVTAAKTISDSSAFMARVGLALSEVEGVGVFLGVGVTVGFGIGVGAEVGVAVGVGVSSGSGISVGVGVGVWGIGFALSFVQSS